MANTQIENNNILYVILSGLWLHLFYNYSSPVTYNLITGVKKIYWPMSVSDIHSETLDGNKNLSHLWTALGFILYIIDTSNFKYFHLLLALLSLFPNKSLNNTCIVCIDISKDLSAIFHNIILILYLLLNPFIRIYYASNLLYSYAAILGTLILIPMLLYNHIYYAIFEAVVFTIISLLVC